MFMKLVMSLIDAVAAFELGSKHFSISRMMRVS